METSPPVWLYFTAFALNGREMWAADPHQVPPTITCPSNKTVTATNYAGINVTYSPATAPDDEARRIIQVRRDVA